MRAPTPPTVLLALALVGCVDRGPTLPTSERATLARGGGRAAVRPISGRCELTITPLPSSPPVIRQTDTGTCQLSHLGRTGFAGVLELNLVTGTQRGERTFTAANGDELRAVNVGTSTPAGPGLVRFSAVLTFVGGTGRFANATGEMRGEGTANLVTRTTSVTFDGTIAYAASDRSGP